MSDYHQWKRDLLDGAQHIGQAITSAQAERRMSPAQERRRRARNIMTDEVWQYRALAGGAIIAELSYGYFLQAPLYGVTVFCVGELARDAPEWDHSLSGCFTDQAEVLGRLAQLNAGGRERIAALAAAA